MTRHADALLQDAAAALADPGLRKDLAADREWLGVYTAAGDEHEEVTRVPDQPVVGQSSPLSLAKTSRGR
ncbi:hypothetical protein OG871_36545 [Kitasatospora sp. NBC_00374]|uniref:hypothetical protein n=1 Tax=Kitasatospora sp. NBC_00374 TaxID=2975964 RepID=UPI00324B8C1A